jgi:hypothetical protein
MTTAPLDSIPSPTVAARSMADRALHHARVVGAPHVDDPDLAVANLGATGLFVNLAVTLHPVHDWERALATVEDVVPRGSGATLVSPFATPDLDGQGWSLIGHPPLMVRRPDSTNAPRVPAELRIHEVVDQPGLEVFERTLVDSYPVRELQPYEWGRFLDERVLGGPTRFWVAFVGGQPAAVAVAHVAAGVNDVEMIATPEVFRGRGYGAALTWTATTADPTLPAVLIASDLGRPVYERLGYLVVDRWTIWYRP